jgi:hypothetical protein
MDAVEASAVVGDSEDDAIAVPGESEQYAARLAVPRDVGQAFLRDAVENELDIRVELSVLGVDPPLDGNVRASRERAGEIAERTRKSEMVEYFGAQLLCDAADLVEVGADRLLCFLERGSLGG